jgi:hypothetical protein
MAMDLDRRWAVEVTNWRDGERVGEPFFAGRYYFDSKTGERNTERDDLPPTATFDTRAAALRRCKLIRGGNRFWRTTAKPVRVRVSVERE